jgi:hypothetical protein
MELVIYKPNESDLVQAIEFNHEEIKAELAIQLKKYENLVYSESSIKEAKTDRATLNKFKDAIENRRKEIKKACLKPYEDFESKVKEIVAMIDKPIMAIDTQVKTFEKMIKDEKLDGIKQVYADRVGDLAQLVPFDKIYNARWLNATYKGTDIEKEIIDLFARIDNDLRVIAELQSEYELQIKDAYLQNFDLAAALQEKTRLEEQAAKMAEYKRIQAERQNAIKPTPVVEPEPTPPVTETQKPEQTKTEPIYMLDFRVWGTREQLSGLQNYLKANGLKYGKVE